MKATIVSTDQIIDIQAVGHPGMTKARVWEGATEQGVRFVAYIPLVQVARQDDNAEFERSLSEQSKKPYDWTQRAIDMRFIV